MKDVKTLLLELSACTGVSGQEQGAAEYIAAQMSEFTQCRKLPLGSLVCGMGPKDAPVLMTAAHMDEIGFIVTHIEDSGFLRVANVGGIDRKLYAASCVQVHTDTGVLKGVIASTPPHLKKEKEDQLPAADEIVVDIGYSKEQAEKLVHPGDRITFDSLPAALLDGSISAKALDDRACCAAVMLAAEQLRGKDLALRLEFVFTSMEEVGSQGAKTAAQFLQPNYAVALDVSFAPVPDATEKNCGKLFGGPMLGIAPVLDNAETRRLQQVAQQAGIPLQTEVMSGSTGTDADEIACSGAGVHTVLLSIPQKYMHTPVEVVAPQDVQQTAQLLAEYILALSAAVKEGTVYAEGTH